MTFVTLASVPLSDLLLGAAMFFLGWLAINFAEVYEQCRSSVCCACGRRKMRDVVCAPQDRTRLAAELTGLCSLCNPSAPAVSGLQPAVSYLGDHDADD